MSRYPEFLEIDGIKYKINTDFRYAIKCNEIAENTYISDVERALSIICILFGEEALEHEEHYNKLLKGAKMFLLCGKEREADNTEPDMDYNQDMDLIEASFTSDYGIDLENTEMHWWKFSNLMSGLSNSELGNCCVLNRVRNLRNTDTSNIKDTKLRQEIEKQKKQWALHKKEPKRKFTQEEQNNINSFYDLMGGG